MRKRWQFLGGIVTALAVLSLTACGDETGPTNPTETFPKFVTVNSVKLLTFKNGMELRVANDLEAKWIEAEVGGTLSTDDASLTILPNSIPEDLWISMAQAADGTVSFLYGPNGLQFSRPAILEINAASAELTGVDLSKLRIAVAQDDVDDWAIVDEAVYDPAQGVIRAELNHFSRYALCMD